MSIFSCDTRFSTYLNLLQIFQILYLLCTSFSLSPKLKLGSLLRVPEVPKEHLMFFQLQVFGIGDYFTPRCTIHASGERNARWPTDLTLSPSANLQRTLPGDVSYIQTVITLYLRILMSHMSTCTALITGSGVRIGTGKLFARPDICSASGTSVISTICNVGVFWYCILVISVPWNIVCSTLLSSLIVHNHLMNCSGWVWNAQYVLLKDFWR